MVCNKGTPIPLEALQVIFNPLVQVAKSRTEPHERPSTSLGLGLFIAREIVLAHGGTIEVSSTAEAGLASDHWDQVSWALLAGRQTHQGSALQGLSGSVPLGARSVRLTIVKGDLALDHTIEQRLPPTSQPR